MTGNTGALFPRRQPRRERRVVRIAKPTRIEALKEFIKAKSPSTVAIAVGVAFGVATLTARGFIPATDLDAAGRAQVAYSPALLRPALSDPDEARVPEPSTYRVQEGDTLLSVAFRYGSTVEAISLASNLTDQRYLQIGQVLTIPPARSTLQTVEPGSTAADIAAAHGIDTAILTAYNGIADANDTPIDRNVVVLPPNRTDNSQPFFASTRSVSSAMDAPHAGGLYYVEHGDTLLGIALKLGVDPEALARLNRLNNMDSLAAGAALDIPVWGAQATDQGTVRAASLTSSSPATDTSRAPSPTVYEVAPGDTVETLADRFGVDTWTIVNNNELPSADQISVGSQLTILPISGLMYTVQPGDTLASIAERYQVDLGPVIDFNYLSSADRIAVGMELILPGASPLPPPPPPAPVVQTPSTYVVQAGDTVLTIAKRFGVDSSDVVVANRLNSADRLSVGQELKIVPGAGRSGSSSNAGSAANAATGSVAQSAPQQSVTRNLPVPSAPAANSSQQVRPSSSGGSIVSIAMGYKGSRYVFGGTTPAGFDCSGFVYYVANRAGTGISRGMWGQYGAGAHPSRGDLQPGDIVFFQNTYMAGLSHNGIYIGGGQFIHASDERTGVTISNLSDSYWASRWFGATRVQ